MLLNTSTLSSNNQIQSLFNQADREHLKSQQDSRLRRSVLHQKQLSLLDQKIDKLKTAQKNSWRSALLGAVLNFVSSALTLITPLTSGLSFGIKIGLNVLKAAITSFGALKPFEQKAQKATILAAEVEKLTQEIQQKIQVNEEHLETQKQHRKNLQQYHEKTLQDYQQSKAAMLKI